MRFEGDLARHVVLVVDEPAPDVLRCFLVGAVLQETGEEKVTGLKVRLAGPRLLVHLRKEARCLHVEQRGCDDEELTRARQVGAGVHERDKLVGHLRERNLRDIEFLAGYQ